MTSTSIIKTSLLFALLVALVGLMSAISANAQIYSNPDFGMDNINAVRQMNNQDTGTGVNTGGSVSGSANVNTTNGNTGAGSTGTGSGANNGTTPGLPETGAGGNMPLTLLTLLASGIAALGGLMILRRKLV